MESKIEAKEMSERRKVNRTRENMLLLIILYKYSTVLALQFFYRLKSIVFKVANVNG